LIREQVQKKSSATVYPTGPNSAAAIYTSAADFSAARFPQQKDVPGIAGWNEQVRRKIQPFHMKILVSLSSAE